MRTKFADIWNIQCDAVCVTTNGLVKKDGTAVMGAGVAKQATERYPGIATILGRSMARQGNVPQVIYPAGGDEMGRWVVSLPVKHHWNENADLELIVASCHELVDLVDEWRWNTVVLPRPGCGNGRLSWASVAGAIGSILDDRFVVVDRP